MTNTTPRVLAVVAAAAMFSACASSGKSAKIRYDMERGFDAAQYRDYHVIEHGVAQHEKLGPIMKAAVNRTLATKGYRAVDKAKAATYVSVKLLLGAEQGQLNSNAAGAGRGGVFDAFEGMEAVDRTRDKTMVVFLQDAKTHRIVWVGWSQITISSTALRRGGDQRCFSHPLQSSDGRHHRRGP
jgi:hypothetical protein